MTTIVDEKLVDEACRLGGYSSAPEAVTAALEEYVRRRKQSAILDMADKVEYDPDYDYKALRRRDLE
jgi:Arc/MetJ family transcription regulator